MWSIVIVIWISLITSILCDFYMCIKHLAICILWSFSSSLLNILSWLFVYFYWVAAVLCLFCDLLFYILIVLFDEQMSLTLKSLSSHFPIMVSTFSVLLKNCLSTPEKKNVFQCIFKRALLFIFIYTCSLLGCCVCVCVLLSRVSVCSFHINIELTQHKVLKWPVSMLPCKSTFLEMRW